MNYGPEHLLALLHESPKRASDAWPIRSCAPVMPVEDVGLVQLGDLAVRALIYGNYAYHFLPVASAAPEPARAAVLASGVHLLAAMVRDLLWRASNHPTEGFVVVAVEDDDHAAYVIGDELQAAGEAAYRLALSKLEEAKRDGWPRWRDSGMMVLE